MDFIPLLNKLQTLNLTDIIDTEAIDHIISNGPNYSSSEFEEKLITFTGEPVDTYVPEYGIIILDDYRRVGYYMKMKINDKMYYVNGESEYGFGNPRRLSLTGIPYREVYPIYDYYILDKDSPFSEEIEKFFPHIITGKDANVEVRDKVEPEVKDKSEAEYKVFPLDDNCFCAKHIDSFSTIVNIGNSPLVLEAEYYRDDIMKTFFEERNKNGNMQCIISPILSSLLIRENENKTIYIELLKPKNDWDYDNLTDDKIIVITNSEVDT